MALSYDLLYFYLPAECFTKVRVIVIRQYSPFISNLYKEIINNANMMRLKYEIEKQIFMGQIECYWYDI